MKKETGGQDRYGDFAPKFAELTDDVLFGEVWSREEELSPKIRSIVTVSALVSNGNFEQLTPHLERAKENGVTKEEAIEIFMQLAFYTGWPKAWSAMSIAEDVFSE